MKRVGILSMQNVDNYGSVLQSYGLKRIIEALGGNVEFVDIKRIDEDYLLLPNHQEIFSDEGLKKDILKKIIDKELFIRIKNKIINRRFPKIYSKFRNEYLDIEQKSDNYDAVVIGSDEVFNCLNSGWWGYTSQLFGNVSETENVITYAASCGATKYENIPEQVKNSIKENLNKIREISVRDENTHDFVENMIGYDAEVMLDPVLIYDFKNEVDKVKRFKLPEKYCLIYGYGYRFQKKEEINAILKLCKDKGITPVAVQGPQTWCKFFVACDPFECLEMFRNAEFVVTDTFHGTIFAAKFAKRFAIVLRESNYNKLSDLVQRIDLDEHVLDDVSEIEKIYNVVHDKEKFEDLIKKERRRTYQYLSKNIFDGNINEVKCL